VGFVAFGVFLFFSDTPQKRKCDSRDPEFWLEGEAWIVFGFFSFFSNVYWWFFFEVQELVGFLSFS